jgi:hypothetical protein
MRVKGIIGLETCGETERRREGWKFGICMWLVPENE